MRKQILCLILYCLIVLCLTAGAEPCQIDILEESTVQYTIPDSQGFIPAWLETADKVPIGEDNRIVIEAPAQYPYSAIAMMCVSGGCVHGTWNGTGFMVNMDLLMTTGHCLYCPQCHTPASSISLYFGYRNERNYLARYQGNGWHAWVTRQVAEGVDYQMMDYAIIQLEEPLGMQTGYFGIRWNVQDSELLEETCHVTGYRNGVLRDGTGRMEPENAYSLIHYADMEPGNSGAPVCDEQWHVIAINSAEDPEGKCNYAIRMTDAVIGYLMQLGFKDTQEQP